MAPAFTNRVLNTVQNGTHIFFFSERLTKTVKNLKSLFQDDKHKLSPLLVLALDTQSYKEACQIKVRIVYDVSYDSIAKPFTY